MVRTLKGTNLFEDKLTAGSTLPVPASQEKSRRCLQAAWIGSDASKPPLTEIDSRRLEAAPRYCLFETPEEIIAYRYNNDFDAFGGEAPTPITPLENGVKGKWKTRGTEQGRFQELVDEHGWSGVANRQNPVGPSNKNKDNYMNESGYEYNHKSNSD